MGESCSFGLLHVLFVFSLIVILVIYHFALRAGLWFYCTSSWSLLILKRFVRLVLNKRYYDYQLKQYNKHIESENPKKKNHTHRPRHQYRNIMPTSGGSDGKSRVIRKSVFGVSEQLRQNRAVQPKEIPKKLEISDLRYWGIVLSM